MKKALIWMLVMLMFVVSCGCAPTDQGAPGDTANGDATAGGADAAKAPIKVALCLVSPANDGAWSTIAYRAVEAAKEKYGIEFVYTENVKTTDMEAVFTDYASQGVDLIIGHSFSFGDAALAVGKRFPDVAISIMDGSVESNNVASYNLASQEHGYLVGVFAALITKTGKVGVVSGVEGPAIIKVTEGFKLGARSINPDITIMTAYTGSFDDAAKCKEAAQSMIDAGVDVIMGGCNQANVGMIKACEEAGIICTGEMEQQALAPKTVAFCLGTDVGSMVEAAVKEVVDGKFSGGIKEFGYADGVLYMTEFGEMEDMIPQEVKDKFFEVMEELRSGNLHVEKIEQITPDN